MTLSGNATFTITSPSNPLAPGIASEDVGVDIQVVSQARDGGMVDKGVTLKPFAGGDILAQTPELDSLALLGTGALGMPGYGITRKRAGRRK
jgi:hypothetical protein